MVEVLGTIGEVVAAIRGSEPEVIFAGLKRSIISNLPPRYPEPTAEIIQFPTQKTPATE